MNRLQKIEAERVHQGLSYRQLSDMTMLSKAIEYHTLTHKQCANLATMAALETALKISNEIEKIEVFPCADASYVRLTESRISCMWIR